MLLLKIRWVLIGFALIILGGTLGYRLVEGWSWLDSIWMMVITLTTIGYGEVRPLSDAGRVLTMFIIVTGVGLGTYTASQMSRYIIEGDLRRDLSRRRRKKEMEKLKDHYIIAGFGRLGQEVAAELRYRGNDVVAIDLKPISESDTQPLASTVEGDASSDDILSKAGVHRARGIAICTGSEATNILVTLSARQLNPNLHILTKVNESASVKKAYRAGADGVINPYDISGVRMAQGLMHPHAAQLMDQATRRTHEGFDIKDIEIGNAPSYNGPLGELNIPERNKILIVAVKKANGELVTSTDRTTKLDPGDIAVVVGQPDDIDRFAKEVHDGA